MAFPESEGRAFGRDLYRMADTIADTQQMQAKLEKYAETDSGVRGILDSILAGNYDDPRMEMGILLRQCEENARQVATTVGSGQYSTVANIKATIGKEAEVDPIWVDVEEWEEERDVGWLI